MTREAPYLTTAVLCQRLQAIRVSVPATWGRKTILQLYKENSEAYPFDRDDKAVPVTLPCNSTSRTANGSIPSARRTGISEETSDNKATPPQASADIVSVLREISLSQQKSSRGRLNDDNISPPSVQFAPSDTIPYVNFVDEHTRGKIYQPCKVSTCNTYGSDSSWNKWSLGPDH
ncbi:uncharacterized protein [Haliotis asinina]|uniref:uncharacterized protein n=1 Tax=Haliotis asinina TaxID=109174 RepID=UPI0035318D84